MNIVSFRPSMLELPSVGRWTGRVMQGVQDGWQELYVKSPK